MAKETGHSLGNFAVSDKNKLKCKVCYKYYPKDIVMVECPYCYVEGFKKELDKMVNRFGGTWDDK